MNSYHNSLITMFIIFFKKEISVSNSIMCGQPSVIPLLHHVYFQISFHFKSGPPSIISFPLSNRLP